MSCFKRKSYKRVIMEMVDQMTALGAMWLSHDVAHDDTRGA